MFDAIPPLDVMRATTHVPSDGCSRSPVQGCPLTVIVALISGTNKHNPSILSIVLPLFCEDMFLLLSMMTNGWLHLFPATVAACIVHEKVPRLLFLISLFACWVVLRARVGSCSKFSTDALGKDSSISINNRLLAKCLGICCTGRGRFMNSAKTQSSCSSTNSTSLEAEDYIVRRIDDLQIAAASKPIKNHFAMGMYV